MRAHESLYTLCILLGLMAVLAVVETWIPLRAADDRPPRWRPNLLLTLVYFALNLLLGASVIGIAAWTEQRQAGLLHRLDLPPAIAFAIGIVALDFFAWAVHVLMHKVPLLWRFHRVHHSDAMLDVTHVYAHRRAGGGPVRPGRRRRRANLRRSDEIAMVPDRTPALSCCLTSIADRGI